ncbi:MAG: hypothetical protein ACUVXF_10690 [Desulfobaccales bacterium]
MIEALLLGTRLALGLATVLVVGALPALRLAPDLRRLEAAAVGFGLGILLITLWMLALTSLGLGFHLSLVALPPLALAAGLWLGKRLAPWGRPSQPAPLSSPVPPDPFSFWDWLFLGLLALLFLFAGLRAVMYPIWAWDALATWGFKAKVFYLRRAVDLSGFEAHNYYPNLVPLILTYLYLWLGQVNDHMVKIIFPLWGGGLLLLLFGMLRRLGLNRTPALGVTAFLALNGVTLVTHLHIAYADLALTYYTLGAAGFTYLWLAGAGPRRSLPLAAFFFAGLTWGKFEGLPLAGSIILAATITLLWLRPAGLGRRLASLTWPLVGLLAGYLPWRLFAAAHGIEIGADHILGFYPQQLLQALGPFLLALINPFYFGLLWPVTGLALGVLGKKIFTTPRLYLALFLGGNFLAILLAYAVAPTSPFEFHLYLRATLDRLLLHLTPLAAMLVGDAVAPEPSAHPESRKR